MKMFWFFLEMTAGQSHYILRTFCKILLCDSSSLLRAVLSPVLNTTLIIFDPKENGSHDESEENVDSQLRKRFRQRDDFCAYNIHIQYVVI